MFVDRNGRPISHAEHMAQISRHRPVVTKDEERTSRGFLVAYVLGCAALALVALGWLV